MTSRNDEALASVFAGRRAAAYSTLRRHMDECGLTAVEGWRIHESTREGKGGFELVLRPFHLTLATPRAMECVVHIDEVEHNVWARCTSGDGERDSV